MPIVCFIYSLTNRGCKGHISGRHCNAGVLLLFLGTCLHIELPNITILYICVSTFSVTRFVSGTYMLILGPKCRNMMKLQKTLHCYLWNGVFPPCNHVVVAQLIQSPDFPKFCEGKWCRVCFPCLNFYLKYHSFLIY